MKGTKKNEGILGGFLEARKEPGKLPVRVETGKTKDLSGADVEGAVARLKAPRDQVMERPLANKTSKHWPKKSLIKGNKTKLSIMAIPQDVLDAGDPVYAECLRLADGYRKVRARELVISHGFVSSGVSAFLATAALSLAASRYLYQKAAANGEASLLATASKLATDARQSELAAWELCARESKARKAAAAEQEGQPWLIQADPVKRPRGRPRKDKEVVNAGLCITVTESQGSPGPEEGPAEATASGTDGTGIIGPSGGYAGDLGSKGLSVTSSNEGDPGEGF